MTPHEYFTKEEQEDILETARIIAAAGLVIAVARHCPDAPGVDAAGMQEDAERARVRLDEYVQRFNELADYETDITGILADIANDKPII